MRIASLFLLLLIFCNFPAAAGHPAAKQALLQARKLLEFHFGPDERIEIDKKVNTLKPIKNPTGKGHFEVLEVWGFIYKGQYRMRFIYAKSQNEYILMGQEILEFATL